MRAFRSWGLLWPRASPAGSTGGPAPTGGMSCCYVALNTPQRSVRAIDGMLPCLGHSGTGIMLCMEDLQPGLP